ncbi:STAS domain-containing protein [Actinoplanes sp. NPDC048796]|uniref:STAS domain-containing protein n=1 Tax=Actinoplanes sp. NPDC048796 TaxID=3155640 RepID=UPI0033FA64E2
MIITAHRDTGGQTRLELDGALDMGTAGTLDDQVARTLVDTRPHRLIVDVTGVNFCDSSGIHALVRARDTAHRHGAAFAVHNPVGITRRTLEIAGLLGPLTMLSSG